MDTKSIERAALGRALYPGMLYDCRSDSFLPGITLWDKASITQDLDVRRRPNTDLRFSTSDSLSDKASLLDVKASLKASFLGGLVEVGGSAKYLQHQKSSANQSRVTLQQSQTTRFEQLTMTQLSKITYPKVFDDKTATHVVTAVLYGSQVFMVFDRTVAANETVEEIEGNLNVMVKKIPSFSIEGQGALKMDEKEKKLAESISCKFYGDCVLEENPTTYIEALQLYKKLPSLLKDENAVPVRVWLYPLTHLDSKAAKMEREISNTVASKIESVLEELEDAQIKYSELERSDAANKFQDVKERLKKFQKLFSDYEIMFQKVLRRFLPAIRGGETNEKDLIATLNIHYRSPFVAENLNKWLEDVQGEIGLLNSYTAELSGVQVMTSSAELKNILLDPRVDTVVCFSFTSLKYEDPYLSSMTKYLQTADEFEKLTPVPPSDLDRLAWFNNPDLSEKMKENVLLFKSFADANKDKVKKNRFVIAPVSDSSNPGASICLYRKGKMVDSKFQPVSKPPKPNVDIQNRDVILKLKESPTGVTVRYRVEYRATKPGVSGADGENWEFTETPDTQETFTLTGLNPANKYQVRYRAVSDVGMSEASDPVCFSFQGKAVVPVGQSWDWSLPSLFADLSKKTATNSSRWSLSTIQSEVSNRVSNITSPYVGKIPGQLKPGTALFFQGVVHPNATGFVINLKTGPGDNSDIIFHLNPRINEDCVALAIFRNGNWENTEFTQLPVCKGSAFDLVIVIGTEGYDAYLNGNKFGFYKHRMPVENVTTLQIKEDVFMNNIGFIPDWNTSTFCKKLNVGNMTFDAAHLVCQPGKPYVVPIPGGVRAGLALLFQGVVPSNASSFQINLMAGPRDEDDVLFHYKPCVGKPSVVRDSFRNGKWENPQETWGGPFLKGGSFDILMVVKQDAYEVIVNGHANCTFNHRMPLETVSTLYIIGDVFMYTYRIIEVESVNLKVNSPALV